MALNISRFKDSPIHHYKINWCGLNVNNFNNYFDQLTHYMNTLKVHNRHDSRQMKAVIQVKEYILSASTMQMWCYCSYPRNICS